MPRSSSGTRNVARSLATAMSAIIATSSPPAWQMPFTAAITGAGLSRIARNGRISWPSPSGSRSPGSSRPPRSPPGANTSPVPVMISAARTGSVLTRRTARLRPKYMAGVKALRAAGRSMVHQAITPSRSRRRPAAPRSSSFMPGPPCLRRPPGRSRRRPARRGERGLVEGVLGQAHVGGVDQPAVAPDGADTLGLGPAVGLDRLPGVLDLGLGGREHLVGDADLGGVDRPLAVEAEKAGVHRAAAEALGVLVGRIGGVDGVDAGGSRRGDDLEPGEVPEVAGVLADRVEIAVDPGALRRRQVAGAEDDGLQPVARPGDLDGVGQSLGLLDEHLERDPLPEPQLRLQLGEQHVDPPDVAGRARLGHDQHVERLAGAGDHLDDVAVAPRRLQAVDPHGPHRAPPVLPGERGHGNGAGALLGHGSAGVLQVEEDQVGAGRRRLLAHALAAGGRRQLRPPGPGYRHGSPPGDGGQMTDAARSSARRSASRPSMSPYTASLSAPSARPRWSTRPGVSLSTATGACTVTTSDRKS